MIVNGYNPCHIKLGHPMLYPYSDKKLCSCPPSVDFLLLTYQLAKTNIEGAELKYHYCPN